MRQTNTAISYDSNYNSYHPLRVLAGEKKEAPLSEKEQALLEVLKAGTDTEEPTLTTLWILGGINGNTASFRKLIIELKDQSNQAPDVLRVVIGDEAMDMLKGF